MRNSKLLLALLFICACSSGSKKEVVAWVNDNPIYLADFKDQLEKNWMVKDSSSKQPDYRLKLKCLENMIKQQLILEEASRVGIRVSEQELQNEINKVVTPGSPELSKSLEENGITMEQWKERFKNDLLMKKTTEATLANQYQVTENEMKDYYQKHRSDFSVPAQVQLRQIVVSKEDKAKELLAQLSTGADFGNLARKYSEGPEADKGGDLGWVEPNDLPQSLHDEIDKLKPNQVSGLIKSPFGFHILQLANIRPPSQMNYEAARPSIQKIIAEQKKNKLYQKWIQSLWAKSRIKINYQVL
jgi:parvulin-like peptidyl-prolyl isomerase